MATSKQPGPSRSKPLIVAGLTAFIALFLCWNYFKRPPQMGADAGVFKTVDALFTAVNAHDEKLIAQCQQRLHSMKANGKLPLDAAGYLDDIIQTANNRQWQEAGQSLYKFMEIQRRD